MKAKTEYLVVKSKGEIDPLAFELLGASSKRGDDTKIGHWGSGLKYSIASLLRNNVGLRIYSGKKEVKIGVESVEFRDIGFSRIVIDGNVTSLTTDMGGADWDDPFFPVREIYSNSLDEPDSSIYLSKVVNGESGYSLFYIEMTDAIVNMWHNFGRYFTSFRNDIICEVQSGKLYPANGKSVIYRKGIKVYEEKSRNAVFDYDIDYLEINESRVIKDTWDIQYYGGLLISRLPDQSAIRSFIMAMQNDDELMETRFSFSRVDFSNAWKEYIKGRLFGCDNFKEFYTDYEKSVAVMVPQNLLNRLVSIGASVAGEGSVSKPKVQLPMDEFRRGIVDSCIAILKSYGYVFDYRIELYKFSDVNVIAQADVENEIVCLSLKFFGLTEDEQCTCMIEEVEHLRTNFADETRHFQQHFINLYYNELKNKSKE